ncbi:MAG: FecR domain-containing protein, partial [Bacteroidota bacterium]
RGSQRLAQLEGEAFFDVAKDGRPFIISTPLGQVEVLGTTFNVYSRDRVMRVSCATGSVRVSFSGKQAAYTLKPGNSVSLESDGNISQAVIPEVESLDWLTGRSSFNNRPLQEVLAALERQYDLMIVTPSGLDLQQRIQTTFPNGNEEQALEIVFGALDQLDFRKEGKVITLSLRQ